MGTDLLWLQPLLLAAGVAIVLRGALDGETARIGVSQHPNHKLGCRVSQSLVKIGHILQRWIDRLFFPSTFDLALVGEDFFSG